MLKGLNSYFEELAIPKLHLLTFGGAIVLGILDYLNGPELSFSVFYTAPIMIAGWYGGKSIGFIMVGISALVWLGVDLASGSHYSSIFVPVWNMLVRLVYFVIILWLLLIVREKLALEESLADTDPLTGLANRRFFQEQLDREFNRLRRYPEAITIVYLDLDNFKYVNDTLGHDVGDELLKTVAHSLSRNTRDSDYVSRQGGDEFAILFPLLGGEAVAGMFAKLQNELLHEMQERGWPVTFSIGAVTFTQIMDSSRDMLKRVDDLMYEVKKSGKNNIRHITWPDDSLIKKIQYGASLAMDKTTAKQKKPL